MSCVIDAFSPEEARLLANKMYRHESAGWGDEERALSKVARQCGMSAISFKRLMKGQRKGVDVGLSKRIRLAYLNLCNSLIAQLQNDVKAIEETHGHDAVADFKDNVDDLAAQVRAAKERAKGR